MAVTRETLDTGNIDQNLHGFGWLEFLIFWLVTAKHVWMFTQILAKDDPIWRTSSFLAAIWQPITTHSHHVYRPAVGFLSTKTSSPIPDAHRCRSIPLFANSRSVASAQAWNERDSGWSEASYRLLLERSMIMTQMILWNCTDMSWHPQLPYLA